MYKHAMQDIVVGVVWVLVGTEFIQINLGRKFMAVVDLEHKAYEDQGSFINTDRHIP